VRQVTEWHAHPSRRLIRQDSYRSLSWLVALAGASATDQENSESMLDVRAPHGAVRTWRFFLRYRGDRSLLLIAIVARQTVEYFQPKASREDRRSLAEERRINEVIFTTACNELTIRMLAVP
jgi:hypothetical protein